ncbi:uncharacterized protein LOC123557578 [Mercenaria mercenaria]|uniref:uncharacterized protein LOC123557578 n=1 Tax=Mercenaria mercenaria TaxID=6596 RepID=UPI00234F505B|nr:uncharacterized protein LOC123557578 [Mercenaria mercenaria]
MGRRLSALGIRIQVRKVIQLTYTKCTRQTMRVLQIVLAVVVVFDLSAVSANENLQIEVTKAEEGEDIVTIKDENGKVLSTNDFHLKDGYELQKPNDENDNVCLISRLSDEDEQEQCYSREPVPEDLEHGLNLEECENREVFLLKPADCPDDKSARRLCIWVNQIQCYCAERYCSRKGWWGICTSWSCKRYAYRTVKTYKCY